jgi:hypothetical protein
MMRTQHASTEPVPVTGPSVRRRAKRLVISGPALALLAGCTPVPQAAPAPRPIDVAADPSEYRAFLQGGSAELRGQAFLTTRGGEVRVAAGRLVTLDLATNYAREWFRRFGADAARFDALPPDTTFVRARKTTTANAEGRFRFSGLAPGDYIVRTTVTWEAGVSSSLQGGVVAALVSVKEGQADEVVLNQVYSPDAAAALGVRILTEDQLSRPHRVVGRAVGVSCQVGLVDSPPTEAAARVDIAVNAARQNADAVTRIVCTRHGMSLRPNCTARIVCEGDAIAWDS